MPTTIIERFEPQHKLIVKNRFIELSLLQRKSDKTYATRFVFKRRGTPFLTITMTHEQLIEVLECGTQDYTFLSSKPLYGVSDDSTIYLYNTELIVTETEMKLYKEIIKIVDEKIDFGDKSGFKVQLKAIS